MLGYSPESSIPGICVWFLALQATFLSKNPFTTYAQSTFIKTNLKIPYNLVLKLPYNLVQMKIKERIQWCYFGIFSEIIQKIN